MCIDGKDWKGCFMAHGQRARNLYRDEIAAEEKRRKGRHSHMPVRSCLLLLLTIEHVVPRVCDEMQWLLSHYA